jgi:hypothetical protein
MKDVGYNILADHVFSQVEKEGNRFRLFSSIIGHCCNGNMADKADQMRVTGKRTVKNKTCVG